MKTARALVEDTKVLVQNAMANQEKLAQAAQSSVTTITHLAEVVKLGAAILGSEDPETQLGWGVCGEQRLLIVCVKGLELRVKGHLVLWAGLCTSWRTLAELCLLAELADLNSMYMACSGVP